jgi:hypothetical protein
MVLMRPSADPLSVGVHPVAHHRRMLFIGPGNGEKTDSHEGYVAGCYRDGAFSDIWTNVSNCEERLFTAYVPACECGWRSTSTETVTAEGYRACQEAWMRGHFERLAMVQPILRGLLRPLQLETDFLVAARTVRINGGSSR